MNNQIKTNRKTKKPYSLFTYFCLLLTIAVMCVGATFARYVTENLPGDVDVGVAHLACSFSLEDVSSTTFSNSDYWVPIEGKILAQNQPREIAFTVRNYKNTANGTKPTPSEVDLQSTFRFFAPKELLGKVAFQILKKGDGDSRSPITQQYVLPTIINKALAGETQINTTDFTMKFGEDTKPADYGEYKGCPEETITLTNDGFDNVNGSGKIVAVAKAGSEQVATFSLTAEKRQNIQYEITQVRGNIITVHDGDQVKQVNNMSAPEYYNIYQADEMVYYCLDITLPSMILKAKQNEDGTFESVDGQFIFAFTIIENDDLADPSDKKIAERFNVKDVSLYNDSAFTSLYETAVVKVVNNLDADGKTITSSKYYLVEDNAETEFTLAGNTVSLNGATYYIDNITQTYLNNPLWDPFVENPQTNEDHLAYKISEKVKKSFKTDMRVLFTQASQSGGN